MFTDQPNTPARLEVFLEVILEMRKHKLDREAIRKLFQTQGLTDRKDSSNQSMDALKAVLELGLVTEGKKDGLVRPSWHTRKPFDAKIILLSAIDEKVLSSTEIEPWFAMFYSYVITQDVDVVPHGNESGNKWSNAFNKDIYGRPPTENPFNSTKYTGLRRWLSYVGLGWHDAQDNFIPNPYERVQRKLKDIFGKKSRLTSEIFMSNLASNCPELDEGEIFKIANTRTSHNKTCTRALATALRDLHDDKIIKLDCPADNRGWSLIRAGIIRNPREGLSADSFSHIDLLH